MNAADPSPRRILVTADAVGGVWTYAIDLAAGFARRGVETVLAVLGPAPDAAQRDAASAVSGLTVVETGLPLDWTAACDAELAATARRLAALADQHGVDTVHCHAPALIADAPFRVPVVVVNHSCLATWHAAMRGPDAPVPEDFAWRIARAGAGLAQADQVLAPTAAFADATARAYGLATAPSAVHNGRAAPIAAAPGGRLDPSVFTAGRLWDEAKGAAVFDAAAGCVDALMRAAGPLIGPNGARAGLNDAVALGSLTAPEMAEALARRPVFCSAAFYEPFGLSVLEAAQAGCALVLSDIPTFRELWDGVAVFTPPGDSDALAAALRDLLPDEAGRIALGEAARARSTRFTVDRMAAATLAAHAEVAGARSRRERAA
ncbi:glycosyl transferase [Alsobacter metallidurans]|uniref:Glycosyl transferase n=1 Tax=Alsobacter metallidurans TaxID=340221 RepID=A0A917ID16_9HYPH|nr:glycosyltransferase family 4 protein [Alsobacter metallidurans]GGH32564.1 glycosyl transferase [Alsobacter metallidurans]